PRDLHSFPTRRSSDLDREPIARMRAALVGAGHDPAARGLLDDLVLEGFAEAEPGDYDVTQSWARDAERAGWLGLASREQAPAARSEEHTSELQSRGHL